MILTTAFHFLISKRGALPAAAAFFFGASSAAGAASAISTSSALFSDIVNYMRGCLRVLGEEQERNDNNKDQCNDCVDVCLLLALLLYLLLFALWREVRALK